MGFIKRVTFLTKRVDFSRAAKDPQTAPGSFSPAKFYFVSNWGFYINIGKK